MHFLNFFYLLSYSMYIYLVKFKMEDNLTVKIEFMLVFSGYVVQHFNACGIPIAYAWGNSVYQKFKIVKLIYIVLDKTKLIIKISWYEFRLF